jgi:hypothetical protein
LDCLQLVSNFSYEITWVARESDGIIPDRLEVGSEGKRDLVRGKSFQSLEKSF